jgi:hypothetical protein
MGIRRIVGRLAIVSAALVFVHPVRGADDPSDPLDPLAWTVGGQWVAHAKTDDGGPLAIELNFTRAGHGKTINNQVVFMSKDKAVTQYQGTYWWHPTPNPGTRDFRR